LSTKIVY